MVAKWQKAQHYEDNDWLSSMHFITNFMIKLTIIHYILLLYITIFGNLVFSQHFNILDDRHHPSSNSSASHLIRTVYIFKTVGSKVKRINN